MIFEIGKLYRCPGHYILLFPTKEMDFHTIVEIEEIINNITTDTRLNSASRIYAEANSAYWSKILNCKVIYLIPNKPFLVLRKPEIIDGYHCINVLFGDKAGYIIWRKKLYYVENMELNEK